MKVLTILGSESVFVNLKNACKKANHEFHIGDISDPTPFISTLTDKPDTDIAVVYERQVEYAQREHFIKQIREISSDIRIIWILCNREADLEFELLCEKYRICDVFYEGSRGNVDIYDVVKCFENGRLNDYETFAKSPESVSETTTNKTENPSCKCIAVFATSHGAGATWTTVCLADFLSKCGNTAAIELTGSNSLSFTKIKADILNINEVDVSELKENYDFLIFDFGVIVDVYTHSFRAERHKTA